MVPRYTYPIQMVTGLVRDALLRRHREFAEDARACVAKLSPPLRVLGAQNVPAGGCYVITLNHYYRPGFGSQWSSLSVSSVIPNAHWIMTGELTFPAQRWLAVVGRPLSRLILGRLARVYGFTTMPPMPPRPRDVAGRAAAVRRVLRFASSAPQPIIALAPEGGDQPGGRLTMPPSGAGRFCLLLAAAGLRFLPVGIYEKDGELTLHFGALYVLSIEERCPPDERDRLGALRVMSHIAPLLPLELRGEFAVENVA